MTARPSLLPAAALLFLVLGCNRDVTLPEVPRLARLQGTLDTGGRISPVGHVVTLVAEDGARAQQTTIAGGQFLFADVRAGLYYLEIQLPGFAPFLRPSLRLRGGEEVDLGPLQPAWLGGTSREAIVTGKVVVAGNGDPAGGQVEFLLQPLGSPVALSAVGIEGRFVQRVPPGTYRLKASHPLYVTTESTDLVFADGEQRDLTADPLSLQVNPATLTGAVLRERDGLPPVPASGALLTLGNGTTTTTDVEGNFRITGLPGGTHTVRASLANHHDPQPGRAVSLSPGATSALPAPILVRLDRGTVSGSVEIADRQPARDVTVALTGTPYSAVVSPDAVDAFRGTFQLPGVPVGVYEVTASKARYSRAAVPSVAVAADATTNVGLLTLTLLQGDFVIEDGDPGNTAGYTRSTAVTLNLASFGSAAEYRASEDSSFAGVPFLPFTGGTSKPFTLAAAQGTHTVYAQYKDATGTVSPAFSASIILDSAPPSSPSIALADGRDFSNQANPVVARLDAQDVAGTGVDTVSGVAHVRLSTSSATDASGVLLAPRLPFQRDTTFTRPTSGDGPETVYAQFQDHAGNASAVVSDQVVIDTARPTGSISIADGPRATLTGYTHQALVDLRQSAGAEPNGGFVRIKLANSQAALATAVFQPVQATSAWFIDPSAGGDKTVYAALQDAAGNESLGTLSATVRYDPRPPSPISATLQGPAITRQGTVSILLSALDDFALSPTQALTASEDAFLAGPGTVGPGPYPGDNLLSFALSPEDGAKQIYVRFRDAAGNDSLAQVRVTRDTTPPSGSFTVEGALADGTPSQALTSSPSVTVHLTQSGAAEYLLGNETLLGCPGSGYTPLPGSLSLSHTLTGSASPRVVALCLRDAAGNTVGPLTRTIALDGAAPSGCAIALTGAAAGGGAAPAGSTATRAVSASLGSCTELPAEIALSTSALTCSNAAGLSWVPYAASASIALTGGDGLNTVHGCARDAARNVASLAAGTITLDTAPPSPVSATLSGPAITNQGAVTLTLSASDASGLHPSQAVTLSEDAFFQSGLTGPMAFPAGGTQAFTLSSGDGAKTVYVRFRDLLGNEAVASARVVKDTEPPVGSHLLEGTLADGTRSGLITSTAGITVLLQTSGANAYLLGDETLAACPAGAAAYAPLLTTSVPHTLTGAASPRVVTLCLRDAAGNTAGPYTQTIALDATTPAGCALALTGARADGSPAPAGLTARAQVEAAVTGCSETPVELVLTTAAVTCAPGAALPWQPFSAAASGELPAGDGLKTLRGCVRDAAGNTGPIAAGTITLDATAPAPASVAIAGPAITNQGTVTLTLSATDASGLHPSAAVTASEDAFFQSTGTVGPSAFPGGGTLPFALSSGDGSKRVYVRYRDLLLNEAVVSAAVLLDTQPPQGTMAVAGTLADGAASADVTSTTSVTVTITQGGATEYLLGNETLTACPASGYSPLGAGPLPHTLTGAVNPRQVGLCLRDAAGNTFGPLFSRIWLDPSTPTGCAVSLMGSKVDGSAAPAGLTGTTRVQAAISGCSEVPAQIALVSSSVTCTAGVALNWETYSPTLELVLPGPDGLNTVRGCVRDVARNTGSVAAGTITLDTTPPGAPQLTIDSGAAWVNLATVTARGGWTAPVQGTATGASEWSFGETTALGPWRSYAADNPASYDFLNDGPKTLYAVFRDPVGNTSFTAVDTITFDTVPPATAPVVVTVNPGGNGFTSSVSVLATIRGAADAAQMLVGPAASAAGCVNADLATSLPEPFTTSAFTVLLAAGDGLKRVCVKLIDAAGNTSGFTPALPATNGTITLDTTPPSPPALLNEPDIVSSADNTAYPVTTAGPVTELNFDRYERQGGKTTSWTLASTDINTTTFNFNLVSINDPSRADDDDGIPNVLSVRAVDRAGNASASSVVITTDIVRPDPVALSNYWVTNGDRQATVHWQTSLARDVVGYRVYYGSAPGLYVGQYADQGSSPVDMGNVRRGTLSGLINSTTTYVQVRPVDHAGNVGDPPAGTTEVQLQPNAVSPAQIASVNLPAVVRVSKFARSDTTLYVLGYSGNCSAGAAATSLVPVDLSRLASPIQGGGIVSPAPPAPTIGPPIQYAVDNPSCADSLKMDVQVDGGFLYLAAGTKLRIFTLRDPMAPQLLTTLELGVRATAVQVKGDVAFVSVGAGRIHAISLAKLYDDSAATLPVLPTDQIGAVTNGYLSATGAGLTWSRDTVTQFEAGSETFRLNDALDGDGLTPWDNNDKLLGAGNAIYPYAGANPVASGNLMYVSGSYDFYVAPLNNVWSLGQPFRTQVPYASQAIRGGHHFSVVGGQAWITDTASSSVRSLSLDEAARQPGAVVATSGQTRPIPSYSFMSATHVYGNYLIVASENATTWLHIFEAATPRSIHEIGRASAGYSRHDLSGGFLFSGGSVIDLQQGLPPVDLGAVPGVGCHYDQATFDEQQVFTQGNVMRVANLEPLTDRDGVPAAAGDVYSVAMPAGVRVLGAEASGSYLVTTQTRSGAGIWLEVFDARKLRDRRAGTSLGAADSVASYQVSATATGWPELTLYRGRAFVAIDGIGAGVYAFDLRNLFDENAATTLGAQTFQGMVSAVGTTPRHPVLQGSYLYFVTATGLNVVDVTQALDEDPATVLPAMPTRTTYPLSNAIVVAVSGGYAFASQYNGDIQLLDIMNPLVPKVVSTLRHYGSASYCTTADGFSINSRAQASIAGTRAYLSESGTVTIYELE